MSRCRSCSDTNRITAKKFISVLNAGCPPSYLSIILLASTSVTAGPNTGVFAFNFSSILGNPLLFELSGSLLN